MTGTASVHRSRETAEVLGSGRRGVTHERGSPRRSFRWHPKVFEAIYDMEAAHNHKVTPNRIASVAVEWGLAFLRTLSPNLQSRILGVKGESPLTFKEREELQSELEKKLGSLTGEFKLDDRFAFLLPRTMKQILRQEAERSDTTMSDIARQKLLTKEAA